MTEQPPATDQQPETIPQLLVMMVGIPGSGKTSFAAPLASRLNAHRLNMDLLRGEIYGTANRQEQHDWYRQARERLEQEATGQQARRQFWQRHGQRQRQAFDKQLDDNLAAGRSVVIDASSDRREARDRSRAIAGCHGAVPVIAWMQAPVEIAIERAVNRDLAADSYPFPTRQDADKEIQRCLDDLAEPGSDEACVQIDGQQEFSRQYAGFVDFCRRLADTGQANR